MASNSTRLHLGCGNVYMEGYVNIDAENWSGKCDMVCDARHLERYGDGSVDEIFTHALLEHLPPWDTLPTLKEWCRVLRWGGVIQIEVPDLQRIFEDWLVKGMLSEKDAIDNIFGGNKAPGRNFATTQHHLTGFTYERLARLMEQAGFRNLRRVEHERYHHILCIRGEK